MNPVRRFSVLAWFAAAIFCLGIGLTSPVRAEQAVVRNPLGADLMAAADSNSTRIGQVPRGERVTFLDRDGFWWKVRWNGVEGWINRLWLERLTDPDSGSAPPAGATAPPAGATAPAAASSAPAASSVATPTRGRALVFGVSSYLAPDVPRLPGVGFDVAHAAVMAQLMGISPDRITVLRDAQVTHEAMRTALKSLAAEVSEGDPVLIYFSGHGTRTADPVAPGRCIEGLLSADGQMFSSGAIAELIQPLARLTDGLFVFFDACHSGGLVATRGVEDGTPGSELRAKFYAKAISNCQESINVLSPSGGTRATGEHYVYLAAAQANEVSLDSPAGGLATQSVLDCMVEEGKPESTVGMLRACAQSRIEHRLAGQSLFAPHHLTLGGDPSVHPLRVSLTPTLRQQLASSSTTVALAGSGSSLGGKSVPVFYTPQQAFSFIESAAADSSGLQLQAPSAMRIDVDPLTMKIHAQADGYIYVFLAGADRRSAVMLYPNQQDRDNRIRAGQTLALPSPAWPLVASGPEGEDALLVVFSVHERDIGTLSGELEGPFVSLSTNPVGLGALAQAMLADPISGEPGCLAGTGQSCKPTHQARIKRIREVR
jgi:Caspase domain/Domain of unknown function (DUF4384)/Bacterial SH3 domain